MDDYVDLPNMPGYVSIKEAARILGLSVSRVYEYVEEGRLSAVRAAHVIMIPLEEVKTFKRNISGRPRKSVPIWRTSPNDNTLLMMTIVVQARAGQQARLMPKLEEMKQSGKHLFPGTVARYVASSETSSGQVEILLIWRSTVMPDDTAREQALEAFRQELADVLDWSTAKYSSSRVLIHT
jgi:excisionase family DNA binding protein